MSLLKDQTFQITFANLLLSRHKTGCEEKVFQTENSKGNIKFIVSMFQNNE